MFNHLVSIRILASVMYHDSKHMLTTTYGGW